MNKKNKVSDIFPPSGSIKLLYKNVCEITSIPLALVTSRIIKKYPEKESDNEFTILTAMANELATVPNYDSTKLLNYIFSLVNFDELSDYLDTTIDIKDIINELWCSKSIKSNYSLALQSDISPKEIFNYSPYKEVWFQNVILNNKLHLTNPKDFNDPFDFKFSDLLYENSKDFRVCCFSTQSDNILLYSNYAEKHTGICYIFDPLKLDNQNGPPRIQKVNYYKMLPDFDIQQEVALCLTTKNSAWKYENEYRLFNLKNDYPIPSVDYDFNHSALIGIILGCEMKFKSEVKSILRKSNHKHRLFEAIKTNGSFGIKINEINY